MILLNSMDEKGRMIILRLKDNQENAEAPSLKVALKSSFQQVFSNEFFRLMGLPLLTLWSILVLQLFEWIPNNFYLQLILSTLPYLLFSVSITVAWVRYLSFSDLPQLRLGKAEWRVIALEISMGIILGLFILIFSFLTTIFLYYIYFIGVIFLIFLMPSIILAIIYFTIPILLISLGMRVNKDFMNMLFPLVRPIFGKLCIGFIVLSVPSLLPMFLFSYAPTFFNFFMVPYNLLITGATWTFASYMLHTRMEIKRDI